MSKAEEVEEKVSEIIRNADRNRAIQAVVAEEIIRTSIPKIKLLPKQRKDRKVAEVKAQNENNSEEN